MLSKKCMCWCFIHYWIEKCTVKQWNTLYMSKYTMHATHVVMSPIQTDILTNIIKPQFTNEGASAVINIHKRQVLMAYPVSLHILRKQSLHQLLCSVFTYNREAGRCEIACWYQTSTAVVACSKQWLWSCTQIWKPFTTKALTFDTVSVNRSQTPATCSHNH